MACIDDKGNLTPTAKSILLAVAEVGQTVEEIAQATKRPLFQVRSSIRDMNSMGFVIEQGDGRYLLNEPARKLLERS